MLGTDYDLIQDNEPDEIGCRFMEDVIDITYTITPFVAIGMIGFLIGLFF